MILIGAIAGCYIPFLYLLSVAMTTELLDFIYLSVAAVAIYLLAAVALLTLNETGTDSRDPEKWCVNDLSTTKIWNWWGAGCKILDDVHITMTETCCNDGTTNADI